MVISMKKNMQGVKRRNGKRKYLLITAAMLMASGIAAGAFSMAADMTARAGLNEVQKVPTSYQVPAAASLPVPEVVQEKEQTNYTVSMSSMNEETPTAADLSMEEAAAVGVKYLEDIMEMDAEGANVYMQYYGGTITFPRAFWSGDVRFGEEVLTDEDTWSFMIDAVTGELFNIGCTETLDVDVPLGYDSSLEENCDLYKELAREIAERCNLVGGAVEKVEYGSQGYSSNNPDITMEVTGESGEMALISFSRYNQRPLGIIMDTSRRITDQAMDDLMDDLMDNAVELPGCEVESVAF